MDAVALALLAAHVLAVTPSPSGAPSGASVEIDARSSAPLVGPVLVSRFEASATGSLTERGAMSPAGALLVPADSAFEYSAAYYTRLDIHRWGSYAMLPLFAFQYLAGRELFDESSAAPAWAREGHGVAAGAVAGLFAVNTVTGVWNLWEGRNDPQDRGRKVFHAVMMLAADAGFTATGLLADDAEESLSRRQTHRSVALASIGLATIGYASMLDIFR